MLRTFSALVAVTFLIGVFANEADAQRRRRPPPPRGQGRLVIQTSIEGAEVLVDEESIGSTPLEEAIPLSPGSHTVRVRRPGYTEFTDVVRIQPGETTELAVDLMALAMVLTVRTTPEEARVFVDDTFRGTTPIELELNEGDHRIRVTHPTHREATREVTAVAGQMQAIDVELEPIPEAELNAAATTEWYEEPVVWISVGGGAVAIAIIIVLAAVLTQGGSQIDGYCGTGEDDQCIHVMPEPWTLIEF